MGGEDLIGVAIGIVIVVAIVIAIIYITVLILSAVATIAAAGGALWGSGTAIANYGKSFKVNMIDSN